MDEDYQTQTDEESSTSSDSEILSKGPTPRSQSRSFAWEYFVTIPGNTRSYKCTICSGFVSMKSPNLTRHLSTVHGIVGTNPAETKRSRPSRSFIWKYCSKANEKQAFCHLCKKLFFFGGGNTSNITKHLRRKHGDVIDDGEYSHAGVIEEGQLSEQDDSVLSLKHTTSSTLSSTPKLGLKQTKTNDKNCLSDAKKERKGASYVWKHCEKVSRQSVLCKLCGRTMRFHGTANVITHLQRKHNITGNAESPKEKNGSQLAALLLDTQELEEPAIEDLTVESPRRQNRNGICSVVWRYCERINEDTVRCRVCCKNLSYQGTSNLQRHLHRMHKIVASARISSAPRVRDLENLKSSAPYDFCQITNNPNIIRCEMCSQLFKNDAKSEGAIKQHMEQQHGMVSPKNTLHTSLNGSYSEGEVGDDLDMVVVENMAELIPAENSEDWCKSDQMQPITAVDHKPFESLYDDIIEEELEEIDVEDHLIEEPFQEKWSTAPEESTNLENPLSRRSSVDSAALFFDTGKTATAEGEAKLSTQKITVEPEDTPRMVELKEELVRQQAVYFNEKASFYRMQKYLVALQVKKERMEIEMLKGMEQ